MVRPYFSLPPLTPPSRRRGLRGSVFSPIIPFCTHPHPSCVPTARAPCHLLYDLLISRHYKGAALIPDVPSPIPEQSSPTRSLSRSLSGRCLVATLLPRVLPWARRYCPCGALFCSLFIHPKLQFFNVSEILCSRAEPQSKPRLSPCCRFLRRVHRGDLNGCVLKT